MSDENERSVGATGSVREPLAFAVMLPDSYVVVKSLHSAFEASDMCCGGPIVPLYRSPSLTDAERDAVRYFAHIRPHAESMTEQHAATLRGLLERTKGSA